jgi:hypothetical protein
VLTFSQGFFSSFEVACFYIIGIRGCYWETLTGNGLAIPDVAAFDCELIFDSILLWKAADLPPRGSLSIGSNTSPFGAYSDSLNF